MGIYALKDGTRLFASTLGFAAILAHDGVKACITPVPMRSPLRWPIPCHKVPTWVMAMIWRQSLLTAKSRAMRERVVERTTILDHSRCAFTLIHIWTRVPSRSPRFE